MIYYSIHDPTKQIWINLELYFKSYDFSNFQEFLGIYLNIFSFLNLLKIIKISKKKGGILSCGTRADATWLQGHVAEPREPTGPLRGVEVTRVREIYLYIIYCYIVLE